MVIWRIGMNRLSRVSLAEFILTVRLSLTVSKSCGYDIPSAGVKDRTHLDVTSRGTIIAQMFELRVALQAIRHRSVNDLLLRRTKR
jgi:hypothetical protein